MTARILVVCTANICRSPTAAGLLATHLGPSVEVQSRGTNAPPGAPMCATSAHWMAANGGPSGDGHRSRLLQVADIRAATLILAASPRHRAVVVGMRPSAQVRTFTLAQAARIVTWRARQGAVPPPADVPDRVLWLAEELDMHRATAPREGDGADDLPDPHRGAPHADILGRIGTAVAAFCAPLRL